MTRAEHVSMLADHTPLGGRVQRPADGGSGKMVSLATPGVSLPAGLPAGVSYLHVIGTVGISLIHSCASLISLVTHSRSSRAE